MVNEREVKATIGVDLDEASFVRLKAKLNAEREQISANMAKAMAAQGLNVDDKYVKQFTREFMAAKEKETRAAQQSFQQQEKSAQKFEDAIANIAKKQTADQERELQKREKRAQKFEDNIVRISKRAEAEKQSMLEKQFNMRQRIQEQGAGLLGGYRGMRAMRMFDEAKALSSAQGGSGGDMAAIGIIAGVTAPIAALAVGGKLLTSVFEDLRDRGQQASSALSEIGGGKNFQQTIVQESKNQTAAALLAGGANLSSAEIQSRMSGIKTKYGIHPEAVNTYFSAYAQKSGGTLEGMPSDLIAQIVMQGREGMSAEDVGGFAGKMKQVIPNISTGQMGDMIAKVYSIQKSTGENIFGNEEMFDKLRARGGPGFETNLDVMQAVKRGGGMRTREDVKKFFKYETEVDPSLSNLATNAHNTNDITTVPGAFKADALKHGYQDTVDSLKRYQQYLSDNSDAFEKLNIDVVNFSNTLEAKLILLNNVKQEDTNKATAGAQKYLQVSTDLASKSLTRFSSDLDTLGAYIEGFWTRFKAVAVDDPSTTGEGPGSYFKRMWKILTGDENDVTNPKPKETIKSSGEKDPTVEHNKATATHTADIKDIMKQTLTYNIMIEKHLSRIGPIDPPQHKPDTH